MTKIASTKPEERKVDTIKLAINDCNVYGRMTPARVKGVVDNIGGAK